MGKPKIRFEGYSEDWEQRKLEDLTKELSDYATMASGLPLLTSSRSGLMYQSDFRDRKTTTSNETLFSIVPKGSCTYRHMSDDDIFHLNINVLEKGLVSREYPVFISSENNDLEFIIQYINSSDRFRAFCKGQKKGGTRTRLYYKTLCEFEMMIPSIEEQKKISATLHNLDHLITLHQRKCDETKTLKKYMLQKMFPQNGEKVPEIRFDGFTEDWEQRKLGEIITEYKETVDSECTLPILTSSKTEGVILQEEHFGRKQQHDITGYNILPRNYCTYRNRSDGVDFTFNINKCCDKGIISKFYPVFSGKNSDVFFLSLVLNNSDEVVREIAYTCTGTGQKVLSFLDLQKMKVRVPSYDEQKEIAAYFENLDHLITLHQRKCNELKEIKKYMLQNMFV